MKYTTLLFGTIFIFIAAAFLYAIVPDLITQSQTQTSKSSERSTTVTENTPVETVATTTTTTTAPLAEAAEPEAAPATVPTPAAPPVEVAAVTPAPVTQTTPPEPVVAASEPALSAGYTLAEVAEHGDSSSCWTVISGNVYDLTQFIERHPGGARNILRLCGTDGTDAFLGQHGGQERAENTLDEYLIGPQI